MRQEANSGWTLLIGAIVAATVTVTVLAARPARSGRGSLPIAAARESTAVPSAARRSNDWREWWLPVYSAGAALSLALAAGWLWASEWRPRPRNLIVAALAIVAVVLVAGSLIGLGEEWIAYVLAPSFVFAVGGTACWALRVPRPSSRPVLCAVTIAFVFAEATRWGEGGQRRLQVVLAVVLLSAWISLAWAGFPSEGAFTC